MRPLENFPFAVSIADAAKITGLSESTIRKSFMTPGRRPPGLPNPPPHIRPTPGRILVLTAPLPAWVAGLGQGSATPVSRRRGARTKVERLRGAIDAQRVVTDSVGGDA